MDKNKIRCAITGYGRNFNLVAVCDIDPVSRDNASRDFPKVRTYGKVADMLASSDADLVCIVTPHNTHSSIAIECLRAGKHALDGHSNP